MPSVTFHLSETSGPDGLAKYVMADAGSSNLIYHIYRVILGLVIYKS